MDRRTAIYRIAGALIILGMIVHAAGYLPFLADDALISLRYADRFLEGHGLTWTDGDRLEGYSNLLWILSCTLLGFLGFDLIDACRILGFALSAGAVLILLASHRPGREESVLPGLLGAAALALAGPLAVWSVGGLEQPMIACLLAGSMALGCRIADRTEPSRSGDLLAAGVLLGLLCWTRPDGALFTAGACGGLLLAGGNLKRRVATGLRLAVIPFGAWAAQQIFRLAYYGDWFPNSAHAKVGFTGTRLAEGLAYVGEGLLAMAALAAPAILLAVAGFRSSARVRFLLGPLVLWCAYVAAVGGDIFPARRHLVPAIVILAFLLAAGLRRPAWSAPGRIRLTAAAGIVLLAVLGAMQWRDGENRRARLERWEWDGQVAGNLLRDAFGEKKPLLAVDPAGTLPYFSRLPSLDMMGINDRYIARHRPDDFGHGPLGHELGDGAYVLRSKPDLVLFCGPAGGAEPCFRSGIEMVRDPDFHRLYRLVTFEGDDPYRFRFAIWVRAEDGRLGIERSAGEIRVPAYLFNANPETVAGLRTDGRVGVALPAGFARLAVPAGSWRVLALTDGGRARIEAREVGTRRTVFRGGDGTEFRLEDPRGTVLDLLVAPDAAGSEISFQELTLVRITS